MATDNRNGPALFPDVTEQFGSAEVPESAVVQPVAIVREPVDQVAAEVVAADVQTVDEESVSDFEYRPTWLAAAPAKHSGAPAPRRPRKPLYLAGAAVSLLCVAGAAAAAVLLGGDRETVGSAVPVPGETSADSGTPAVSTAWCADAVSAGRSVGRGPGSVDNGPGAIRAFDHAYYVERDGGRVASLMVTPNPVPEIQKWIDDVPAGTEHCVTIASTENPNTYEVDLGLRMPDGTDGAIRQRITVAASPGGFRIAKVEDLR
ncbi:hypothetical protein C8K36_103336 [Rhodococcus sp. OK519]|uniref:hypothetical protein n=1 Tax=Rhodococcus sp. OK519 TaxID=2135729 RepID=UPI000D38B926|nr:hypothetical protein C8K36_103336 [Rhodococcus sp. OK519]